MRILRSQGGVLVSVDSSLPGLVFTEAAFLRVDRPKTITGTVAPDTKTTQKRTSSKRDENSGVIADPV